MIQNNPKEFKAGCFRWLDRATYRDLGKLQINLTDKERKELVNQLANSLKKYEKLVLNIDRVRNILYSIHANMIKNEISTSQLSSQFNMSIKGHNNKLCKQIDNNFRAARIYDKLNNKSEAITQLEKANLSYELLFNPKIVKIIETKSPNAIKELKLIKNLRKKLFQSTVKMAISIAKNYNSQLDSNVIEWTDLVQESLFASMGAIEKYRPIDEGKTFTSFIHTWISGILSKKINETTRTVFIPRATLDRYIYVQKAIDSLGLILTDLRGGMRQFNTFGRGKIDYYTLCKIADCATILQKGRKSFSPEEVRKLLLTTQDEISLDLEIEDGHGEESITLGDTIPDETPLVDEQIDSKLILQRLMRIFSNYTSKEELILLKLRYGMGEVRGCKWTADVYHLNTGKAMNKGKVAEIEKRVFKRIRKEISANPPLKRQFEEIVATLPLLK